MPPVKHGLNRLWGRSRPLPTLIPNHPDRNLEISSISACQTNRKKATSRPKFINMIHYWGHQLAFYLKTEKKIFRLLRPESERISGTFPLKLPEKGRERYKIRWTCNIQGIVLHFIYYSSRNLAIATMNKPQFMQQQKAISTKKKKSLSIL